MVIVKVGGSEGINYDAVCDDVAEIIKGGQQLVLIHGGSHLTNQVATALGHPPQFITSPSGYTSRLTDPRTMEIFEMVYCGQVNKGIVTRLQKRGINAVGLSGIDGRIWQGRRKKSVRAVENGRVRVVRNNLTGKVTAVNKAFLTALLESDYLPVLTPPAISEGGEAINVDGDRAAGMTAAAMQASELLILSNVPGVLANFPDESSLIPHIKHSEIETAAENYAAGRMRIKLLGAKEAIEGGVPRVVLGDARGQSPIQRALAGEGTIIE